LASSDFDVETDKDEEDEEDDADAEDARMPLAWCFAPLAQGCFDDAEATKDEHEDEEWVLEVAVAEDFTDFGLMSWLTPRSCEALIARLLPRSRSLCCSRPYLIAASLYAPAASSSSSKSPRRCVLIPTLSRADHMEVARCHVTPTYLRANERTRKRERRRNREKREQPVKKRV
jgi:hypothetical protein